jgi:hypothetical protein
MNFEQDIVEAFRQLGYECQRDDERMRALR